MGETRVDLQHLLEDLRDAYTGALEKTILTEVVANALDSGATRIRLLTSPSDVTLTIVDDGSGMQRRELARYHDIAASTKSRGEGIGFAGVGIKLGRRRTPSATGFIERNPLRPGDRTGIAISTFGKVIKRGWDWLGLTSAPRAHIGGLMPRRGDCRIGYDRRTPASGAVRFAPAI